MTSCGSQYSNCDQYRRSTFLSNSGKQTFVLILAEMEVQLKALVNERNSIKALLIRFKKFFEESKHSETLAQKTI